MEIGRWLYYAVVNCVIICIVTKPFSLNDLIEAESQVKEVSTTTVSPKAKEPELTAERFSLNKGLKPIDRKLRIFKKGTTFTTLKTISPLKYKKTFQIKSPLKPKRVKQSLSSRRKRKNQSVKREINGNDKLKQKYIPVLKSIGMLFDNILGADSSESNEITKYKRERYKYYPEEYDDSPCKCPANISDAHSESKEKAVTIPQTVSSEVEATSETSAEAATNIATSNVRSFGYNKNIPLLLPRNTISTRRNNNRLGKRNCTAHNRSVERNISRYHGISEHDPEWGQDETNAKSNEGYTSGDPRNNASSVESGGGIRDRYTKNSSKTDIEDDAVTKNETEKSLVRDGGHVHKFKRKNQFKDGRDETESANLLSKPIRRLRGFQSEDKIDSIAKSVQSQKNKKENDVDIAYDNANNQRLFNGNGSSAAEDQKASSGDETVIHQESVVDINKHELTKSKKPLKDPVVIIIDGYSVTRHKNGENKLAEKAIHIHS